MEKRNSFPVWASLALVGLLFACAINPENNEGSISPISINPTSPAAPGSLSATVASSSQINLSWADNSSDETGFRLERSATSASTGFALVTVTGANTTSYVNTGLSPATQYWYRVRASNAAGDSSWSAVATATTSAAAPTSPAAPTNLSATVLSSSSIRLNWTDNASNETSYLVERSTTSASAGFSLAATIGANRVDYTNTGLSVSTQYWFRVRCSNSTGNSGYTPVVSATTSAAAPVVPSAPSSLTATVSYNASFGTYSIGLHWADNSSNETGFRIERSTASATTGFSTLTSMAANSTSYTNSSLAANTQYWYRVCAVNAVGDSASSNIATATTVPPSQTTTFYPQYDNLIMISSQNSTLANTVYASGELAVGAHWSYSIVDGIGIQNYVISGALVRFDTSALAGKTIESATLNLTTQYYGVGSYPRQWYLKAMQSSWATGTMTWNVYNGTLAYTGSQITQSPPTYSGQQYSINVLATVRNWADGSWSNNGFSLTSSDFTFPNATSLDAFAFYSADTGSGTTRPRLVVTYR